MSKEVDDPLSPPAGGGVSGEGMSAISSPFCCYQPFILPLSVVRLTAISRSINRYQPFGEPLIAAQQGYNMQ
jgi:hypothetical protein